MQSVIFSIFFLFISCSQQKVLNCNITNWEETGVNDVLNGLGGGQVDQWKNTCGPKFSQADQAIYLKGRTRGLKTFCTFKYGLKFGEAGMSYSDQCEGRAEKEFLRGFKLGQKNREKYRTQQEIDQRVKDLEEGRDFQ
jgi:hypothetical protein